MKRASLALLLALLLGFATGSDAACNVVGLNLSFGPYDPLRPTASTTSGVINVSCDSAPPPSVTILIGPSLNSGGFAPRRMRHAGGTDTLDYNVYLDNSTSIVWGDGLSGTGAPTRRVFRNRPWNATVFGRMPPGQDVAPGGYGDSVTVTINF
jgi:spore coat protein U-like protein